MPLTLTLSRKALNNVDDIAGRWQFEGGSVAEARKHVANYSSIKRVTFQGSDQDGQNTASVTTTLLHWQPPAGVHHSRERTRFWRWQRDRQRQRRLTYSGVSHRQVIHWQRRDKRCPHRVTFLRRRSITGSR
jgi:hypothetical protein